MAEWQTRWTQNPLSERACGFESRPGHPLPPRSRTPAGTAGNDREVVLTKEFWYSPKLGVNLVVKRMDPTQGTQVFTVFNISLAEPDARLFVAPPDYKMMDQRNASPTSAK